MKSIFGFLVVIQALIISVYSTQSLAAVDILADEGYADTAQDIRSKINKAEKVSVLITFGKASLAKALSQKNESKKIIALCISEQDFAVATYRLSDKQKVAGLFLGVDPRVPIAATKVITPDATSLIAITKETHISLTEDFQNYMNSNGGTIKTFYSGDTKGVFKNLEGYRALVVYPDLSILNEATIRALVMNLYRKNKYVVGWTEDQVKNGVLLAPIFNDEKYTGEAVEFVQVSATKNISPRYSTAFDIKINQTLYRSLAISPESPTSEQLTELVKKRIIN